MPAAAAIQVLEIERDRLRVDRAQSLRLVPTSTPAARIAIESLFETRIEALELAIAVLRKGLPS